MENQNSNKNEGQTTISVQVPSAENIAQRRNLIPLAFGIALVFFLFNFLNLQFLGNTVATFTGLNFVTGTQLKTHDLFSGKETGVSDFPSNVWAIIAFISSIIGLVIFLIKEKREALFGVTTGIIGFISLIVFQITLNAKVVADGGGAVFGFGYWGALVASGVACFISYLRMRQRVDIDSNISQPQTTPTQNPSQQVQPTVGFDIVEWFNKNRKLIIGIAAMLTLLVAFYYHIPQRAIVAIQDFFPEDKPAVYDNNAVTDAPIVESIAVDEGNALTHSLPFVGKKFYDTHPALSGSGTPRYFVEIKENGDVFFGYDAPNMNGADIHEEVFAGKYKPVMECKKADYATGQFLSITKNMISVTDRKGEMTFSPDCCGIDDPEPSMEGDTVLCPCDSEYF